METKPNILEPQNWWVNNDNEILLGPSGQVKIACFYALSTEINGAEHAICAAKAVKNTYGKNINPENIQELIEAFKEMLDNITAHMPEKIIDRANNALNNIKYKE